MKEVDFYHAINAISERIKCIRDNKLFQKEQEEKTEDEAHLKAQAQIKLIKELHKVGKMAYGIEDSEILASGRMFEGTTYYHYTDLNGLKGIFDGHFTTADNLAQVKQCTMRASHVRFLNDLQEYNEGNEHYTKYLADKNIEAAIEEYRKGNYILDTFLGRSKGLLGNPCDGQATREENIYSISFCGDGDLLSQWKYYGKNSGIAIEFDFEGAKWYTGKEAPKDEGAEDERQEVCPLKIAYTDAEKLILLALCCLIPDRDGELMLQRPKKEIFIPFCKNKYFKEESESRLVFSPKTAKCEFAVSDGKIKPYIPITLVASEGNNLIKSITVGPGENQNLVFNALKHIFYPEKFSFTEGDNDETFGETGGVKIKKSKIPFRS